MRLHFLAICSVFDLLSCRYLSNCFPLWEYLEVAWVKTIYICLMNLWRVTIEPFVKTLLLWFFLSNGLLFPLFHLSLSLSLSLSSSSPTHPSSLSIYLFFLFGIFFIILSSIFVHSLAFVVPTSHAFCPPLYHYILFYSLTLLLYPSLNPV